jgi:hypothetical protein
MGGYVSRVALALVIVCGLGVSQASAAAISLSGAAGFWTSPVGGSELEFVDAPGQGQDTVKWGDINGKSGYHFTPTGDATVLEGSPFLLGTFTHFNQVISGDAITEVDYALSFNLEGGVPMPLNVLLHFLHDETNNDPATCFPESVSLCDDIVTTSLPAVTSFFLGGTETRYLHLLGFSQDGGLTFANRYLSVEGGTNAAMLYGLVSAEPAPIPTPEPATLALFGAGLAAAVAARHRARRTIH